jgi:hypothetical protein
MRFIIGAVSGVLGMLAGWAGLAMLVISVAGPDREGGVAMGAFFSIGPIGGLIGFVAGVLLFIKFGMVPQTRPLTDAAVADVTLESASQPVRTRVSLFFAIPVLAVAAGLGWWAWYELIRSPYLSHGYMTLELQFKLPAGMPLPSNESDVHITMTEGRQITTVSLGRSWHGTDGDRRAILAKASLSMKTNRRVVTLEIPNVPEQTWVLNLSSDPDPTPGFSPWRLASGAPAAKIEMNFSLSADH